MPDGWMDGWIHSLIQSTLTVHVHSDPPSQPQTCFSILNKRMHHCQCKCRFLIKPQWSGGGAMLSHYLFASGRTLFKLNPYSTSTSTRTRTSTRPRRTTWTTTNLGNYDSKSGARVYYDSIKDYSINSSSQKENTILLVGDGDLSNGASMSLALKETRPNCNLIASVLESEPQHNDVYRNSCQNIDIIRKNGHEVRFEVDATRLSDHFPSHTNTSTRTRTNENTNLNSHQGLDLDLGLDRIQFNFPHWRGKTNNRRNRTLISNFLASSQQVLSPGGQIHMALLKHQGGMRSSTNQEWKGSWLPAVYAAEHGMLLSHLEPFRPGYDLSSYQFRDRPFHVLDKGRESYMHIFTKVVEDGHDDEDDDPGAFTTGMGATRAPEDIQMFSHFALFITFPVPLGQRTDGTQGAHANANANANASASVVEECKKSNETTRTAGTNHQLWTNEEIFDETFLRDMVQSKTPPGIRTEIKLWRILRGKTETGLAYDDDGWNVAEYKVFCFGERQPITFEDAEVYKKVIEDEVELFTRGTRRGGWASSHIIPSSILRARGWFQGMKMIS